MDLKSLGMDNNRGLVAGENAYSHNVKIMLMAVCDPRPKTLVSIPGL